MTKVRTAAAFAVLCIAALCLSACAPTTPQTQDTTHHRVGSALDQPFPNEWQTGAWWVDPANVTGCANDNNTGTSATCTAGTNVGPLASWQGLNVLKWGCRGSPAGCPRLRQNTTITFLSSHSSNADPVVFVPTLEAGAWAAIVGNLGTAQTTISSGVLANITAKNRSTPQLLQASVTNGDGGTGLAPTGNVPQLIINTTHPSRAWTNVVVTGSTYSITEPLVAIAAGAYAGTATEVDTWANGDVVAVYNPVSVDLVRVAPLVGDNSGSFSNGVYLETLVAYDPGGATNDLVEIGRSVVATDVNFARSIALQATYSDGPISFSPTNAGWGCIDCWVNGAIVGGPSPYGSPMPAVFGGRETVNAYGAYVDYDAILANNSSAYQVGNVFVISGKTLSFTGSSAITGVGSGTIWGTGTVNAAGDCRVSYPAGASKAAATFTGVTLNANGQTKTCLEVPSSASAFATCNTTLSAANLDTNLGATAGCLVGPGAAFCNSP